MLDGEFPKLGAWVHYGLGTLNENLPQFIRWATGNTGTTRTATTSGRPTTPCRCASIPRTRSTTASPKATCDAEEQQTRLRSRRQAQPAAGVEYPDDPALDGTDQGYELAFRMQKSLPEVLDFAKETEETKKLYGLDDPERERSGCRCWLLAGWSSAGFGSSRSSTVPVAQASGMPTAACKANHERNCLAVDKPIAGLLKDLKRTGLLKETSWCSPPSSAAPPARKGSDGRDHHIYGFSVWMAGGGIKGGVVHGATDEIGFHAVENRHYVTDVHATILHQLGLDSRKLEIPGRKRLDIDHGTAIKEILG